MNVFASVILVGILWLITSVPVITIGASSCAAYDTTVNVIRKGRGYSVSFFFESFKTNFFVSLPVVIILMGIMGILGFDCIYLYGYGTEFSQMLLYIIIVFAIVFTVISFYIFPVMQRFDESRFEIMKLAFYITFRHIFTSVILLGLLIVAIIGIYYMPWSILLIPGIWWFIVSIFIEKILGRFSTESIEEDNNENVIDNSKPENVKTVTVKRRKLKNIFKSKKEESLIEIEKTGDRIVKKD